MSKTPLSSLGEFKLIDHLTRNVKLYNNRTIKGIGDDTAAIEGDNDITLLTKDLLIEGVHFNIMYTPLKHLGYKSIVVNLSDIYAMNGHPTHVIAGIAVSSRYTVEALEEIYEGMMLACEKYKIDLVGGDTTSSASGLFISVTALGKVSKDRITYRSGARPNDLICVTGNLGGAYAGLLILEREKEVFKANPQSQPDLSQFAYVLERQLKPEARKDIVDLLMEKNIIPTSMIDISDGLASEILHICKSSNRGTVIYEEKLPIDVQTATIAHEFKIDPTTFALNGGEEYELLFTIDQKDYDKIKGVEEITVIGHITENPSQTDLISTSGNVITLRAQGWDSFRKDN
ncbi:MAG: thiamine-phosphate kinase [Bacteroidetes bacterium]|nr:MAG: thiamine-phosphate kinase [Bacteroidota bacterium]